MSEKLIKPYEISVWEDKLIQNGDEYKFIEKKLAVIGSDTMAGLNKVYNPVFHKKTNGEKTLSFSLKYKYFDPYLGNDDVVNPFVSLLTNERKVKLHYDDEWYEFIVKEHTESSEEYEWTYTCNDAFVLELSKNGYNLTFDSELNNNQGTAKELAAEVLKDTSWKLGENPDVFKQLIAEPIYKATLRTITGIDIVPMGEPGETITGGIDIYLFYSFVKNKNGNFVQFIIRDNNYKIDDKNVITDTNYKINTKLIYKEDGFYLNENDNLPIISFGEIETKYQANRLAYNQLTTYDPVMQRTVDRFQIENDEREVYRYIDYIYTTSNIIINYITNGENFNILEDGTLQGWNPYVDFTGMESEGAKVDKLELITKPELKVGSKLADLTTLSQIEGFLKVKFKGPLTGNKNAVFNSGIENNASSIQSIAQGEKFVFRWRAGQRDPNEQDTTKNDIDCLVDNTNLRLLVAKYTQDTPNRWSYYYKHIDTNNIILDFNSGEIKELNNIIRGGIFITDETGKQNYVIDDVVQVPSTKYVYEIIVYQKTSDIAIDESKIYYERIGGDGTDSNPYIYEVVKTPIIDNIDNYYEGETVEYVWDGLSGAFVLKENAKYLPYHYMIAEARQAIPNTSLKDPTEKYGIFIYSNDNTIDDTKPIYIQDIQLTRFIPDAEGNPIVMGNVPVAKSDSTSYYYIKPEVGSAAEDVITYTDIDKLKQDLGISSNIIPLYNETFEKTLSISASKSNCFDILQTIAETFECWVDLVVEHDENGYITYTNDEPDKFVYLKEYIGKENHAGFKYGINLKSIERNVDSNEIVTKLIVDQSQSEYVDAGFISIASAPSNTSGESYILNFDYYYGQNLLNRTETEQDRINTINLIKDFNLSLQEKEKLRRDLEASLTALGSKRNVYTELVQTAQDNLSESLGDFEDLTGMTYQEYQEAQDGAKKSDNKFYVLTKDEEVITNKKYYSYDGTNIIEVVNPTGSPVNQGWYELLPDYIEEETIVNLIGTIYVSSATINNYSGILTNIENEYWNVRKDLRGVENYTFKVWTGIDDNEQRHIYLELNDYFPGFSFTFAGSTYESDVSTKYFDIQNNNDNLLTFATPNNYIIEDADNNTITSYEINNSVKVSFKINYIGTEPVGGVALEIKQIQTEKDSVIKGFNNKYSRFIQEGTWNSTDYIDSELYYLDALQVSNTSAQPVVSYTINVVEISQIEGFEWYLFDVGDKSYVEDTEFFGWTSINGISTPAREEVIVSEVEWHLEEPDQNTITVQNYKTRFEDLFQRISATVQTVQYNEATYAKISTLLDTNGTINQDVLLESLNNINGREYNLTSNGSIVVKDDIILVQNLTNPANHVIINSEGIRVSSDGGENYTTVIDGQGINIGAVYTGTLNTNEIIIGNRNYPSFRWDKSGISAYHVDESEVPDQYILTEDTEVVVGKIYYILVRSGYRPVEDPTGNPKEQGWYELVTENVTDLKTFVRFDEYGLYGIKNAEKFKAQSLQDILNEAHFAVTWDGFFIRNSYEDGGRVSITSDNDFQVIDGSNNERIKIGSLGFVNGIRQYGINIKNKNGDNTFYTDDSTGDITIAGTINALGGNFSKEVTVGKNTLQTTDYIIIDGENASISSSNYNAEPSASATQGWIINKNGDAVFNNIVARGSIKTAVFEYAEIQAVGGIFIFRPSSTIRSAIIGPEKQDPTETKDLILTVEKQHLFSVDDWVKISNYTTDGSEPDASYVLQENGLTHVYRVSAVNNRNVTLENAAAMVEGNNKIVDIEDLFGGALVSMGHYDNGIDSNNYGIGINSSDNTVNLARRAISLFETEIKPNAQDGIRVKYNYRGILGTLPPMSSGVDTSIYNHMQGTQGIYTDNMYLGDANQYIAFYTDGNNQKQLRIKANQIVFEAIDPDTHEPTGQYHNVAEIETEGVPGPPGEDAAVLVIDSSEGTVFRDNTGTTDLTVTIFYGSQVITNSTQMHQVFGNNSFLEWEYKDNTNNWVTLLISDPRISDDGFTLSIDAEDVYNKVNFRCKLNI